MQKIRNKIDDITADTNMVKMREEYMHMASRYMEEILNIRSHQGNVNQNHNDLTSVRCLLSKMIRNVGKHVEKMEPLCIAGGRGVNWCSDLKQYGDSLKSKTEQS